MNDDKLYIQHRHGLELPLTKSPIRFAVLWKNGQTSNIWGVRVEKKGDVYIYCRDNMQEVKISFHKSGKQHIAYTKGSGIEMTPGSRFWNQWREPQHSVQAIPSFKLYFPSWGTRLGEEERKKATSKWKSNHILIEAVDDLLTAITFIILDKGTTLTLRDDGLPSGAIGVLSLHSGKKLCVIAGYESDGKLKQNVMPLVEDMNNRNLPLEKYAGKTLYACASGENLDGYAYMVTFPVEVKRESVGV